MALRRVYDDASFTLPAPVTASVDGTLVVAAKNDIAPASASLVMSATGFASLSNEAVLVQTIEGSGGGDAHGIIATRFLGGADYGVSINASESSTEPADTLCVSVNGNVGIGKEPVGGATGSLDISGLLHLTGASGVTPAANGVTPVAVANTLVTASSKIFLSVNTVAGTVGLAHIVSRTPGVGFSFVSEAADTSTYDYIIIG